MEGEPVQEQAGVVHAPVLPEPAGLRPLLRHPRLVAPAVLGRKRCLGSPGVLVSPAAAAAGGSVARPV